MKIIRNYLLKDFFFTFTFSILSLTMVMLLGNLMKISDMVIRKGVNPIDALKIFSFIVPPMLSITIPLSFLLGIMLTMGRLISDNEIVALNVAGISIVRILHIFFLIGIMFSLGLFILNDRIVPTFYYKYRSQMQNIYSRNLNALVEPGVFMENFPGYIIYIGDKSGKNLKNVFIYEVDENKGISKVTFARRGEFVIDHNILKLKLEDGFRDEIGANETKELYRLNFRLFFVDIPITEKSTATIDKKAKDMPLDELTEKIKHLKSLGIDATDLITGFHKRISFSFSILAFIILGFGSSLAVKHREKSINFGIAFDATGIYYLLLMLGEALIDYKLITPIIGMWLPNILMSFLGAFLIYKYAYSR